MSCFVRLTDWDVQWASSVGIACVNESMLAGYRERDPGDDLALRVEISKQGACAELAICRWARIFWHANVNTYNTRSDLPGRIEVRSKQADRSYMKLRDHDRPKGLSIFVSVTKMHRERWDVWRIDGWQWGQVIMAQPKIQNRFNPKVWQWQIEERELNDDLSLLPLIHSRIAVEQEGLLRGRQWEDGQYALQLPKRQEVA
jgi:hypothetical protein